jgi:Flp pilus assembly protein TadD
MSRPRYQRVTPTGVTVRSALALAVGVLTSGCLPPSAVQAADSVISKDAPDLTAIRTKIKAKDWPAAIADLNRIADTVQHADIYNLLGFSLRKSGDYSQAYTFYTKALEFDPNHRSALEYMGELFVETGEMERARGLLQRLVVLCPTGCEELEDLEAAIKTAAALSPGTLPRAKR